jgi:hypothetical protein
VCEVPDVSKDCSASIFSAKVVCPTTQRDIPKELNLRVVATSDILTHQTVVTERHGVLNSSFISFYEGVHLDYQLKNRP